MEVERISGANEIARRLIADLENDLRVKSNGIYDTEYYKNAQTIKGISSKLEEIKTAMIKEGGE